MVSDQIAKQRAAGAGNAIIDIGVFARPNLIAMETV
jgi:hypothetical protein